MTNKALNSRLVFGTSYNPWYNLAVEEYLIEHVGKQDIILYLWQNDNTVVIGRNQNAWQECHLEDLRRADGKLARRLSGGGAVFHDLGNLNYTLLMKKKLYNLEEQLTVIIKALNNLGLEAEFSGRNDIVCCGKKISGNAFYYGTKGAYIHGTVLIDTDLDKLTSYLKISSKKIQSKGIDSVKSRVMNLTDIDNNLTVAQVKDSIQASFQESYNQGQPLTEINIDPTEEKLQELYDKYSAWDWRFGAAPDCDISIDNHFTWGEVEINLKLVNGYIEQATIYSDAMYGNLIEQISATLEECPFKLKVVLTAVKEVFANYQFPNGINEDQLAKEFITWFKSELEAVIF